MPQEYRLILKHADEPGYTPDLECYLRHGGYETLEVRCVKFEVGSSSLRG